MTEALQNVHTAEVTYAARDSDFGGFTIKQGDYLALEEHQARHYQAELASRLCLSGPHKDDIAVTVNGLEARHFCSQGQVRTAALSLKLADREIHKNAIGEYR